MKLDKYTREEIKSILTLVAKHAIYIDGIECKLMLLTYDIDDFMLVDKMLYEMNDDKLADTYSDWVESLKKIFE